VRRFFFKHCWWVALLLAIALGGAVLRSRLPDRGALAGGLVAIAIGFCYFAHQQKLAEVTLFKQLFTEFNARYDRMNGRLAKIEKLQGPLQAGPRQVVVDYFNLCAEEYLFYREGYIPPEVWRAWCRGMLYYIEREPFASIWAEEYINDCYYGLTTSAIYVGAGTPNPALQRTRPAATPVGHATVPLGGPGR
jgi:hypothetical protein